MSFRQNAPGSDPLQDLATRLRDTERTGVANSLALQLRALPEPITFRITLVAVGPPPTYEIEIVNQLSGNSMSLGVI